MYIVYSTDIMCIVFLSNIPVYIVCLTWVVVDVLGLTVGHLWLHLDDPGGRGRSSGNIDPHKLDRDILWNLF